MKKREEATAYQGIFKITVLNKEGKWVEPVRGCRFNARRYEKLRDGTIKRTKRGFKTLAEAKVFRFKPSVEEKNESFLAPNIQDLLQMKFKKLVESWVTHWLPTINIATQLKYKKYLKHFAYLGDLTVSDIQPSHIDAWIAHVKRPEYLAGCQPTRCSYENEFKVLKAILNYYSSRFNRNYRSPILKDHLKMLKVKDKPLQKKDLTIEQFTTFIQELKKLCWGTKWECVYYLALMQYATYARIQEAAALYVEDFDLANNRLEIKRKVQWLRRKGYRDQIVSGAKANGGKVFSPIPELAIQVFNEWKMRSGVRSGLLFQVEGALITYRKIQHKYDLALKNAQLPFRATHILRHAALAEAYSASHNILVVQKFAGHASLRATEKYAKARDEQIVEVQKKMDERLSLVLK